MPDLEHLKEENCKYYCIKVPEHICIAKEIYLWATTWHIDCDGTLSFFQKNGDIIICFAINNWHLFYAASLWDGAPLSAYFEHWDGEYIPPPSK